MRTELAMLKIMEDHSRLMDENKSLRNINADLLAALEKLTELVQYHGLTNQAAWPVVEVWAAISKAKGE